MFSQLKEKERRKPNLRKNADELVRDLFLAMAAALMKVCSHNTCYP